MKKKVIALVLTAACLSTTVAGCGNTSSKNVSTADKTDKSSEASKTEAASTDSNGKVDGVMYSKGLPLVDPGAYTFSMFCDDSSSTGKFAMLDEFAKQTNVKVDLQYYPYENATEKLNLALNSGDYADCIGGWTLTDSTVLTYGPGMGVFIPLEDYFAKYCPNITKILQMPGVKEQMTAPDGHIYTIPYVCGDTTVQYSPYINGDWLKAVGMKEPTTTDEFEAVLKAFKEKDANGDGNPNNEIPFTTDPNNKHLEKMAGYFGLPLNEEGLSVQGDKTVYGGTSKQYREFLSWFAKLYKEGLVDNEIFTQDSATWEGKGSKNLYGCSIAYGSTEIDGQEQKTEKNQWDPLPVLDSTDSKGIWLKDTDGFSVYRTQAVITDKAKNPEVICRWFDNAFELENGIGCSRGPVGVIVNKDGDKYRAIDTTTLSKEDQEKYSWPNLWPQSLPKFMPVGFKFEEDHPLYDEKKAVEKAYADKLTSGIVSKNWVSADDASNYAELSTALKNYFSEQQAQFISGEQDVNDDAQWKAYVDGMNSLGLNDWLKMRGIDTIVE